MLYTCLDIDTYSNKIISCKPKVDITMYFRNGWILCKLQFVLTAKKKEKRIINMPISKGFEFDNITVNNGLDL